MNKWNSSKVHNSTFRRELDYNNLSSGGGGDSLVVKSRRYSDDRERIADLSSSNITCEFSHENGDNIAEYVSYDSDTKEFTILKSFIGFIAVEVVNARSSGSAPAIVAEVNGDTKIEISARGSQTDSRGLGGFINDLVEGDKIMIKSPSDKGYPIASVMFIICSSENAKMLDSFNVLANGVIVE